MKINAAPASSLSIGDKFYINYFAIIDCQFKIVIGNDVKIGPHVYLGDFDHVPRTAETPSGIGNFKRIVVEDGVWIGANSVILKGVAIGSNSIVAAGAVVTKDVPPNTVVAGVPAREIKSLKR
ncbi:acyltransferase [Rubripirellula reticaptiva]|uniref:acyltransferase n=1 Tax=Rubripirellula reticaptiva TaxID=2528013 RepID=UPI001C9697EC